MSRSPAHSLLAAMGLVAVLAAGYTQPADAQFGRRLKDAVKRNAEDKAIQKAVDKENEAIDGATSGGGGDSAKSAAAADTTGRAAPGAAAAAPPAAGSPAAASPAAAASPGAPGSGGAAGALRPGEGAWANYDFKPGERLLFVEDFTKDEVGNFPARLVLKRGNAEIVEWQGRRLLSVPALSLIEIPLPEALPERFTIELDYFPGGVAYRLGEFATQKLLFAEESGLDQLIGSTDRLNNPYVNLGEHVGISGPQEFTTPISEAYRDSLYKLRVMADGPYAKVYVNERRVANAPGANLPRSNKLFLAVAGNEKAPTLIGSFRIAAGGKKLYDALAAMGRVATQGIYFDTGSDQLRPESTPTLKEIGTMLKEHPELKLTIEGHTDNVGQAATNQTLSEKRAAAVRQFLISSYQVEGARLQAKGLGQTKPAASNDTPEGRQQNRRVELVRG